MIGLAAGSGILIPASYGSFHPVTSSESADNTIQSVDIKDGEVKAADIAAGGVGESEIAANSVGASELKGVTKLIFATCTITIGTLVAGAVTFPSCGVPGVDSDDRVLVTKEANDCLVITRAYAFGAGIVTIGVKNVCGASTSGSSSVSVIVFDT